MLGKLLKQEIKATARIIPFIYLTIAVLGLVGFLGLRLRSETIGALACVFMILTGVVAYFATLVLLAIRFYKSMYSNEGYLTLTLPVRSGQLLFTKAFIAFLWIIASTVIMFGTIALSFILIFHSQNSDVHLSQLIPLLPQQWGIGLLLLVFSVLLSSLYFVAQVFFSITLANTGLFHRQGAGISILVYLAVVFVLSMIEQLITLFVPLSITIDGQTLSFSTDSMAGFFIESITTGQSPTIPIGIAGFLFEMIAVAGLFVLTNFLLKRKICLK